MNFALFIAVIQVVSTMKRSTIVFNSFNYNYIGWIAATMLVLMNLWIRKFYSGEKAVICLKIRQFLSRG
jgi:hypothetical protein